MRHNGAQSRWLACALLIALAACGGGSNTPDGSVVNDPGQAVPTTAPLARVNLNVTVTVPVASNDKLRRSRYISTATRSLTIGLASVNGVAAGGFPAATIETSAQSSNCTRSGANLICTGGVKGSPGDDVFNVSTFAGSNGTGPVLSFGSVAASAGNGSTVGISGKVALSLASVVGSLALHLGAQSAKAGQADTVPVTLQALDPAGATIVGSSDFAYPVALAIQGDSLGAFSLHAGTQSGETLTITKPPSSLTLSYDGNQNASSIAVQATVSGDPSNQPSAQAPFSIEGGAPSSSIGQIFVLNRGSNAGLGASVSVYAGSATGNVAPIRTLALDPSLYAQSIAVDSTGRLYVGYFDSSLGYNPATQAPDSGNEVAVYAAGASGAAKPVSVIAANSASQSVLFPVVLALDPAGELVTIGATAIDANAGNSAIVIYASGASGAVAPAHAWNFASPYLPIPGATGLAVDSSGNFYVAGTFRLSLNPAYGVYVAAASDRDNPAAAVARVIPWDPTTQVEPGEGTSIGLDASDEIYVGNFTASGSGCAALSNAFAAGSTGGTTDVAPLRIATIPALATSNASCVQPNSAFAARYPALTVFGRSILAADGFDNAIAVLPSTASGTVTPSQLIEGSQTGLNGPAAIAATAATPAPSSGRAHARIRSSSGSLLR